MIINHQDLHINCSNASSYNIAHMFVHLRLHTEYSVIDGTNRIDEIVKSAAADGQPALAITDLSNLFGAIKFYKEGRKRGVKPILGAEIWLEGLGKDAAQLSRVLLLVQNHQGYLNLSELLARAWTQNGSKAQASISVAWLTELNGGLICLSGAQAGPVGQALLQGDLTRAMDAAMQLSGPACRMPPMRSLRKHPCALHVSRAAHTPKLAVRNFHQRRSALGRAATPGLLSRPLRAE